MSLTELVISMQQQANILRGKEEELLSEIATIAGMETAEAASDRYDSAKHAYSFEGYLYQLDKLKTVLLAGVPTNIALECCLDAEMIIRHYTQTGGRR